MAEERRKCNKYISSQLLN